MALQRKQQINAKPPSALQRLTSLLAMSAFVGSIHVSSGLILLAAARFLLRGPLDPLGIAVAVLLLLLTLWPLESLDGPWARTFITFACKSAADYFPARVTIEDAASIDPQQPYILAFEPHSALPVAMPLVFATHSPLLPPSLHGRCHGVASSICFKAPLVRQLWWMLGIRPVSKANITALLAARKSVVVIPGGVQECLYMTHDKEEVVFLRARLGIARLALATRSPLVPIFAFGQTAVYSWARPGPPWVPHAWIAWLSRNVGAVPLGIYGKFFSPLPHQVPMHIVIGKPLELPPVLASAAASAAGVVAANGRKDAAAAAVVGSGSKTGVADVSDVKDVKVSNADAKEYLDRYISAMEVLHERYKRESGSADLKLRVI